MLQNISQELENEYNRLIEAQKDFYNHSVNVAYYTRVLINQIKMDYPQFNLSKSFCTYLEMASLLHDIGKITIPLSILNKTTPLSYLEFDLIKKHPQMGYIIIVSRLESVAQTDEDKEFVNICKNVALYHHERCDGTGYPYGLKEEDIPIEAQIIAIVDSFDAMTHLRCYQRPVSKEIAVEELVNLTSKYNKMFLKSLSKTKKILIKTS